MEGMFVQILYKSRVDVVCCWRRGDRSAESDVSECARVLVDGWMGLLISRDEEQDSGLTGWSGG